MEYQEFQNINNQIEVINTIKKIIRKEVTNENGNLKIEKMDEMGVKG